jgi:hypothetical protein
MCGVRHMRLVHRLSEGLKSMSKPYNSPQYLTVHRLLSMPGNKFDHLKKRIENLFSQNI